MTRTTTVRVLASEARSLRQLAFTLSARTGDRVTLSQALAAAVTIASQDIDRALAALPAVDPDDQDPDGPADGQ